tara:strand:+ start:306 stop:635 length:330 start_codon:yes stop_codon:yes gene_type:complete
MLSILLYFAFPEMKPSCGSPSYILFGMDVILLAVLTLTVLNSGKKEENYYVKWLFSNETAKYITLAYLLMTGMAMISAKLQNKIQLDCPKGPPGQVMPGQVMPMQMQRV